jgi:DNA-binding MarR family transcriptional regulator
MAGETSQTLDRGLWVLRLIVATPDGLTVTQLAQQMGISRTVVHRLIATLLDHRLVHRGPGARYQPGVVLTSLGRQAHRETRGIVLPILGRIGDGLGAHFVAFDGDDAALLAVVDTRLEQRVPLSAEVLAAAREVCAEVAACTVITDPGGAVVAVAPLRDVPDFTAAVIVVGAFDAEAVTAKATRAADEIVRAIT